jgi:hypothetical protein
MAQLFKFFMLGVEGVSRQLLPWIVDILKGGLWVDSQKDIFELIQVMR